MDTTPKPETLEERYKKASDAVEKAVELRDGAIRELVEAEMNYGEAVMAWGVLDDEINTRSESRAAAAAWKRRSEIN